MRVDQTNASADEKHEVGKAAMMLYLEDMQED